MATALITGASSGIGLEMAKQLAAEGYQLILAARSQHAMETLASELRQQHGTNSVLVVIDLSVAGSAQSLYDTVNAQQLKVDVLINNAGFGINQDFLVSELTRNTQMMNLNIVTLTELCHLFGNDMKKHGKGGKILNVASVAAYQACPNMSVYCATKAYVLSLTEALRLEMSAHGITVTALCPGATETGFHRVADNEGTLASRLSTDAASVARAGLKGLHNDTATVVPGLMNLVVPFYVRLLPRMMNAWMAGLFVRKPA